MTWLVSQSTLTKVGALLLLAAAVFAIVRMIILPILQQVAKRSSTQWDDILLDSRLLNRISWVLPPIAVWAALPEVDLESEFVASSASALLVIASVVAVSAILRGINEIYTNYSKNSGRAIKGYLQVVQMIVVLFAGVVLLTILTDTELGGVLAGLGAITAVLLLIFQSTILSVVASVQLTGNDMIRIGDWIEVPGTRVDGEIVDIALHTVKVQNWDKTIATIPTHKLVSEAFVNWRGMSLAGARRIKRAILLDQSSVRFLTAKEVERFSGFAPLAGYMASKTVELGAQPSLGSDEGGDPRRLTNLGTFRAYLQVYLRANANLDTDEFTFLVRQLSPTPDGVALEMYVFSSTTDWQEYEAIQADILDHVLSMVPEFGLRVFQHPTGSDVRAVGKSESQA
jgi:miniconductance mechanosensitive channel